MAVASCWGCWGKRGEGVSWSGFFLKFELFGGKWGPGFDLVWGGPRSLDEFDSDQNS